MPVRARHRAHTNWRPLLRGRVARQAADTVDAIATAVRPRAGRARTGTDALDDASLAAGTAGLSVFYAYLARARASRESKRAALRFQQHAADALESVTMDPSLYGGFTGVAWSTAHLESSLFDSNGDSTEAIDETLKHYVSRPGWRGGYDLVSGLVGLGVYALERLPAPAAVASLEAIVDRFAEMSVRRNGGITWHTPPKLLPPHQRTHAPRGYYNLGLAHGVPGIIALLGAVCEAGVKPRKTGRLLDGAVAWLLGQKRDAAGSRFPAWRVPGSTPVSCRSAWCYGDPGVAVALMCAARSVAEASWAREALTIARAAADRSTEDAGVVDAGLCHGAAGLGHLFNRMYQMTGDLTLQRAAQFWFARALSMRQAGRGIAGFSSLDAKPDGTRFWNTDDRGLLTGASGIALALLAATTSIEPGWDRMLLVSTPMSQ